MFDNIIYKYKNRNSKKNLKQKLEKIEKQFQELRKETLGTNSMGWVTFSTYTIGGNSHKKQADDSLQGQLNELRDYLGIEYQESKLVPKPKDSKQQV